MTIKHFTSYDDIYNDVTKLIYAYAEATVPKITITLRKSYGGAHITMGSKELSADVNYAWPSAKIAVMGAESAVQVLKQDITTEKYDELYCSPYIAERYGHIDKVIDPKTTRPHIISALKQLSGKESGHRPWKKHNNLPL